MKYINAIIMVLIISAGLSFTLYSKPKEQIKQQDTELDELVREDIRAIYHLLAKQSSHIRTIMNMSITGSHWATHKDRHPQKECEECLAVYKEIKKQLDEIDREIVGDANKP